MQGSRFMVFSTLILTSVAVQPVVAQDPLPRGTTIERVALESRSGQKASGRMQLAEAFNPAARTGTMSVVVAPGALHDLIAAMHTSKVGGSAAMEVSGLKMEVDVIEVVSFGDGQNGARAVLRVGGVAATAAAGRAAPTRTAAPQRTGTPQRVATPATGRELDASRVPAATRQGFRTFWESGKTRQEAESLERQLAELEARAQRGENVQRELTHVMQQNPQLVQLSEQLQRTGLYLVGQGGDPEAAECQGIGWIGINGKLRCIGKLVTS